jgi:hypothetical protein
MVRIACEKCPREGRYRKATLVSRFRTRTRVLKMDRIIKAVLAG